MATLQSLIDRVKSRLKDVEFDDEEIGQYLNEAQAEVLGESPFTFLEDMEEFSQRDSGELDVPRNYQSTIRIIAALRDKNNRGMERNLEYLPPRQYFGEKNDVTVRYASYRYTVFANKLHIKLPDQRPPRRRDESPEECVDLQRPHLIRHYFLTRPQDMTMDGKVRSVIPDEYSEILIIGALARAEERRGNYDFAAIQRNQQQVLIENMKLRYGPRQLEGSNKARLPYGNINTGWM